MVSTNKAKAVDMMGNPVRLVSGIEFSTSKIFRFDDISTNTDMVFIMDAMTSLYEKFNCKIILGISPLAHSGCGGRVFPKELNAYSDHRNYYKVNFAYIPHLPIGIITAGHGIVHVDHRLLNRQAQELSILTSCSLAKAKIFIPPWNKWNEDTEDICDEHGIELIKYEDGWRSCEHNKFDPSHNLWYLHGYAWTLDKFKEWLEK